MSETERLSAEERAAFTAATADCTAGVALRAALDAAEAEGERVVVQLLRERDRARVRADRAEELLTQRWSESGSAQPLHEWLGMTREEYAAWVVRPWGKR